MSVTGTQISSVRASRPESERLILALAISIALHLIAFGGYEFGKQLHLFPWLHRYAAKAQPAQPPLKLVPPTEPPLVFVDVNPEQTVTEAPKNAKYYSDRNSRAANPDATIETSQPKLNGKQADMAKAETETRNHISGLQPAPPAQQQRESQPKVNPGDLALAKPPQPKPERPRTIRQALAQQANRSPGLQMKQDGGAHRALVPSFDAKATQFGAYDRQFIDAVQQHWYDLLDSRSFSMDRTGRVTLRFHLTFDGRITDMTVVENTVGDVLGYVCQEAITDPAPFEKWPTEMRQEIGEDFREITFTFYYY